MRTMTATALALILAGGVAVAQQDTVGSDPNLGGLSDEEKEFVQGNTGATADDATIDFPGEYDADDDGQVTREEFDAGFDRSVQEGTLSLDDDMDQDEARTRAFDRMDTDSDEVLSQEEQAAVSSDDMDGMEFSDNPAQPEDPSAQETSIITQ